MTLTDETCPLVRDGALHRENGSCQAVLEVWGSTPRHADSP
jgi:hypothetical protein